MSFSEKDKYFFKSCPIAPVIKYVKGELRGEILLKFEATFEPSV